MALLVAFFFASATAAPITTSDINNNVWQNFDANAHLTCTDTIGCANTTYRINSGAWNNYGTKTKDLNNLNEPLVSLNVSDYTTWAEFGGSFTADWTSSTHAKDGNSFKCIAGDEFACDLYVWQYLVPTDLSAYGATGKIGFWVDVNRLDNFTSMMIGIGSTNANRNTYSFSSQILATGWNFILLDQNNPTAVNGTIDWSDIKYLALISENSAGTFEIYFDKITVSNQSGDTNVLIAAQGTTTFDFNSASYDLSIENVKTATIKIDKAMPITTETHVGDITKTITLACTDALSGCAATQYRIDSGAWQTGAIFTLETDGNHKIDYRSTDLAGNTETANTLWLSIPVTANPNGIITAINSIFVFGAGFTSGLVGEGLGIGQMLGVIIVLIMVVLIAALISKDVKKARWLKGKL